MTRAEQVEVLRCAADLAQRDKLGSMHAFIEDHRELAGDCPICILMEVARTAMRAQAFQYDFEWLLEASQLIEEEGLN